ncbi:DNA-3-methyladenine glycosylase I, partial [Paenibacillus sp. p3-SID1389]|uniref:DNA-3-methyladenine glycosylase I n=1 Tax=Paenibacillus sp. p3-SID1389 TaxID=2916364 RepID=UPI002883254B
KKPSLSGTTPFSDLPYCTSAHAPDAPALCQIGRLLLEIRARPESDRSQLAEPQTASTSTLSIALSKEDKKQGWKFVGPTTMYAFMQAMGLFNDHVEDCVIRAEVELARQQFQHPRAVTGKR